MENGKQFSVLFGFAFDSPIAFKLGRIFAILFDSAARYVRL